METFEKITALASSEPVELGLKIRELVNKELCLGMTRYVIRHGSLGEGFEYLTPAMKYFQAVKECWSLAGQIVAQKAQAMNFQADLLDALEKQKEAVTPSEKLRAEAAVMTANQNLVGMLVKVEDNMRQLDEFNKVRTELGPEVKAKYPHGIEQAEPDKWRAVAEYRLKRKTPLRDVKLEHVPLDAHDKAKLGLSANDKELTLALEFEERAAINALADGDMVKYLKMRDEYLEHQKQRALKDVT